MKLKLGLFFVLIAMTTGAVVAADDPFDFDNFTITDSDAADIMAEEISINSDAAPASVGAFDIAGIMLGMSFDDVEALFFKNKSLYVPRKNDSVVYTMHKDWKYNLDYECRQQGTVIPKELDKCIKTLAKNRGLLYAAEVHLVRDSTSETIDVYFTSNATDNRVWRVLYNNDVNEVEGDAEKFDNQRQKKILFFWQGVLDKYGAPNSGSDKWASTSNSYDPMMTAYYGSLDLVDMGRRASDEALNIQQSRENFKAKPYAF